MVTENKTFYAVYSRVLTSGVMRELAKHGRSSTLARLIASLPECPQGTLGNFFDQAYIWLSNINERNEYVYKNVLTHKILLGEHSVQTASVVPELRVGAVKADFTIFNGTSTVYEIKTDRDSLNRLQNQIQHYLLFFDKIHVITGESHINDLLRCLPNTVGVVTLNSSMDFTTIRPAIPNWMNINPKLVFDTLRVNEINEVLKINGIGTPLVPNTQLRKVQFELFKELTVEQVHKSAIKVIQLYRGKQTLEDYINALPYALKAVGIGMDFSNRERKSFIQCLDTSLQKVLAWG